MNNPWEKLPKQNNFYVLDEDKIKKLITIVKPELKLDDIRVKPKK